MRMPTGGGGVIEPSQAVAILNGGVSEHCFEQSLSVLVKALCVLSRCWDVVAPDGDSLVC